MLQTMDLYQALNNSTNSEESFYCYMNYIAQFGLNAGMLVMNPHGIGLQTSNENTSYASTYSTNFVSDYFSAGGVNNDLAPQFLMSSNKSKIDFCIESDHSNSFKFLNRKVTKEENRMKEVLLDHKLRLGFIAGLHTKGGYHTKGMGISAIGMSEKEYTHEVLPYNTQIKEANALLSLFLKRYTVQNQGAEHHSTPSLSQRQRDLLRWLANGLRLQQISDDKIHRSLHTLNKELKVLKQIMQAKTRDELIAKGIVLGIIDN